MERKVRKISKVNFLLNSYGGVEPQSIKFYFELLTKNDSILKNAKLIFKKDKIKFKCKNCGESFENLKIVSRCKKCKKPGLSILMPEDIRIKSIEIIEI
ncbi:MAG: hydrogenase maturation nickel metallochaperone HypA [Actinobacteria bacterium]|nr:hydrogenase maturation nickel metallochaperone HypA [Actinomycetota bacterium]